MAKASLTLKDGTKVLVEGSPEEIRKIISFHSVTSEQLPKEEIKNGTKYKKGEKTITGKKSEINLSAIVNAIKSSEEAEQIEKNILDRSSQVDRILLPLYISQKYVPKSPTLTSGEIAKILSDLGINILQPNAAGTLSSTASKYVIGDTIRQRGKVVRYRLSRRGFQYLNSVIKGKTDD